MAIVKATNLVKVYNKKHVAVDNLSFEIEAGTVYGFLGPNGAGKSSTIKMLTGLLQPTSGQIEIMGKNLHQQYQNLIGYIPQELVFFNHLTVMENAILFTNAHKLKDSRTRIDKVLDLLGLSDVANQISADLSGGQKRRLNVALGLLHSPKLLIMDEPAAGMDPQSRNILWETINKLSQDNITIILTTHLMEVVERLAHKICIIDHGKILAEGSLSDLRENFGAEDIIDIIVQEELAEMDYSAIYETLLQYFGEDRVSIRKNGYAVITNQGIEEIQKIMKVLEPIGLDKIKQVISRHHSLEDMFIALTGRELRD